MRHAVGTDEMKWEMNPLDVFQPTRANRVELAAVWAALLQTDAERMNARGNVDGGFQPTRNGRKKQAVLSLVDGSYRASRVSTYVAARPRPKPRGVHVVNRLRARTRTNGCAPGRALANGGGMSTSERSAPWSPLPKTENRFVRAPTSMGTATSSPPEALRSPRRFRCV